MARPAKQGMDYFPHDTDAASDEKLEALRILHGNDGYAFYFILLERIYRTADFELPVSDAETQQILARKVGVDVQKFTDMLATALKHGCFDAQAYEQRGVLTSSGVQKRVTSVVQKRQKMASAYAKRVSSAETPPETPQSKGKDTNVSLKESKGKRDKLSSAPAAAAAGPVGEEGGSLLAEENSAAASSPLANGKRKAGAPTPSSADKRPLAERWPEIVAVLTDAERTVWEKFLAWEQDNPLPKLFRMKEPLTPGQLVALIGKHGAGPVTAVLLDMQNKPRLLSDYDSANLTAQSWLRRRQQREALATT